MPPPVAAALVMLLAVALGAARAADDLASDTAALQAFIAPFGSASVSWNASRQTCSWTGVVCSGGRVTGLHLPGDGLRGSVPVGALGGLTRLTVLSLRFNALSGPLPADLASCVKLRVINLQSNHFSGELPAAILSLPALTQLNLAENRLSGRIPPAIAKSGKLQLLFLEGNLFTKELPNVDMPSLLSFNVSFNDLTGEVPKGFGGMPATSFLGTTLCGKPLPPCRTPSTQPPSQPPTVAPEAAAAGNGRGRGRRHLAGGAIAGIVIGCALGFLLIAAVLVLACGALRRKPRRTYRSQDAVAAELALHSKEAMSPNSYTPRVSDARPPPPALMPPPVAPVSVGRKKLFFFGRVPRPYDLEDLLRASAEVLGKGTYGTTYKAALETAPAVAVKRLKETSLPEREFRDKIAAIGGLDHPNVVPLQAYYFSKDERLMVYEFVATGSLSSMLHGNRGAGRSPLSWESRRRIALASARGLEYIHATGSKVAHGNIKSSNILLGRSVDARVADHGLASLVGPAGAPSMRVAGYRAPEVVADPRRLSQKADVYSFGVLLLEMLTGKAPTNAALHDEGVDLPRWARSVVREEWTSEVFDTELLRQPGAEEEMVEMLRLAMDCTVPVPDQRPAMPEIVVRIDELAAPGSASSMARPGRSISVDEADDRPLKPAGSIRES
ncbi:probable inactive receptor kinase RLK902 [Triticum urartu]|uniref:Protein kinase domain-containing protein n=1 Tax=Triticum urartu TaxID=4572 RepID=A0A8R7TJM1_TRIUA|nr:probable inactive receptor kinase RLK902 [Triticum dicoccoides]XP_048557819.1 probable inactive receptor kinase RLK902 [Triticum urartu]